MRRSQTEIRICVLDLRKRREGLVKLLPPVSETLRGSLIERLCGSGSAPSAPFAITLSATAYAASTSAPWRTCWCMSTGVSSVPKRSTMDASRAHRGGLGWHRAKTPPPLRLLARLPDLLRQPILRHPPARCIVRPNSCPKVVTEAGLGPGHQPQTKLSRFVSIDDSPLCSSPARFLLLGTTPRQDA